MNIEASVTDLDKELETLTTKERNTLPEGTQTREGIHDSMRGYLGRGGESSNNPIKEERDKERDKIDIEVGMWVGSTERGRGRGAERETGLTPDE